MLNTETDVQKALDALSGETKTIFQDLVNRHGQVTDRLGEVEKKSKELQQQLDAVDLRGRERHVGGGFEGKSIHDLIKENESVQRLLKDKRGSAVIHFEGDNARLLSRKTAVLESGVGFQSTGVLTLDRDAGVTPEARQQLTIENVLSSRPTTQGAIDFVKVNSPMSVASPQTEGSAKAENAVTFTSDSEKVETIATWIPASRQLMDDSNELAAFIDSSLRYAVDMETELQILSGSGVSPNLNGLITQATAFNTALLGSGWTRIDVIARAIQQLAAGKEMDPTFVVMDPASWWSIRLTKDSTGRYIFGDPQSDARPRLFTLDVIPTNSISSGNFLVGSGNRAATEIRDRMQLVVEISNSHSDYFAKNLLAVRAERRLALVTKRPAAFIYGTFSSSP